jgi:hypothetical protein
MKIHESASWIWPLLALAARNRQVLTYDLLGRLIGIPRFGLGKHLEPIQSYCLLRRLPPLTALVVNEKTGLPGDGFIAAQDVPAAQQKCFQYDWLKETKPRPGDLLEAVRRLPSCGIPEAARQ